MRSRRKNRACRALKPSWQVPWSCLPQFRSPVPHSSFVGNSQIRGFGPCDIPNIRLDVELILRTSPRNMRHFHAQGRQDSNLQPAVLETAALPIAPLPFDVRPHSPSWRRWSKIHSVLNAMNNLQSYGRLSKPATRREPSWSRTPITYSTHS